jgi:hypothetical protein
MSSLFMTSSKTKRAIIGQNMILQSRFNFTLQISSQILKQCRSIKWLSRTRKILKRFCRITILICLSAVFHPCRLHRSLRSKSKTIREVIGSQQLKLLAQASFQILQPLFLISFKHSKDRRSPLWNFNTAQWARIKTFITVLIQTFMQPQC